MAAPVIAGKQPIPPPILQVPWDDHGAFLTPPSYGFLQLLWAAIQGQGGLVDQFVAPIATTNALVAGSLVNVYDNAGNFDVRTADSSAAIGDLRWAVGFVRAAFTAGQTANIYFSGVLSGLVGLTPGPVWMGLAGAVTQVAPVAGVSQIVGIAVSPTALAFQPGLPVGL